MSDRADYVHRLLLYLEECGWSGAPRFIGIDDEEREILSFIPGYVAWEDEQLEGVGCDDSLHMVARLVREFHDLTAECELAHNDEVVCHNDLAPRNTVYRDGGGGLRPVAFIDWDLAAPGKRIHDIAHMCWQYGRFGPRRDIVEAARRARWLCDSYGLEDRTDVVDTIMWWQDRCWRGIDSQANAGVEAMIRLRDRGAVEDVRATHDWVCEHRSAFEEALR